jgi:hypothetical protein
MNGLDFKKARSKGQSILAKYFQGHNGPEKIMNETCPLKMQVEFKQDLETPGYFVVAKHLPYDNCARPPAPTHKDMFVQDFPEQFAYVSVFGGVPDENEVQKRLEALLEVMDNEGKDYESLDYFATNFENTYSLKRKTNEVVLISTRMT